MRQVTFSWFDVRYNDVRKVVKDEAITEFK